MENYYYLMFLFTEEQFTETLKQLTLVTKFNAEAVHHLLPVVKHADEADCIQHLSDIQPFQTFS